MDLISPNAQISDQQHFTYQGYQALKFREKHEFVIIQKRIESYFINQSKYNNYKLQTIHSKTYSLLTNDNKARIEFNPFLNFLKFIELSMPRQ